MVKGECDLEVGGQAITRESAVDLLPGQNLMFKVVSPRREQRVLEAIFPAIEIGRSRL